MTSDPPPGVHPFTARATDAELEDLRARIRSARLPEAETVARTAIGRGRWAQGVPLADLVDLLEYWRADYDWRVFESRLNELGQYTTDIDGLGIHFLHRRSSRGDAVPLILTHGWPGSVVEFAHLVEGLAEPDDPGAPAFHVVVPSLPGFGYSERPSTTGWGTERIAAAWTLLMDRLGYDRFLAHGGDWGGVVTMILAGRFPERVIGVHTTFSDLLPGLSVNGLTDGERTRVEQTDRFESERLAYAKIQQSSPQTLGYSLVDSPVGLLAFLLEKFAEWTDTTDSPFETISRDRVLDDVTLYWLTRTGASAARIYTESHHDLDPGLRVDVPAAITIYPKDISTPPRAWAEHRYRRIVRWREPEHGGHFPSLELPEFFLDDLRDGLTEVLAARE